MFLIFQGLSDKTIKIFMSFALKPDLHALRSYLRLICEYNELYTLPNSAAKDHGQNYMKDRPLLAHHL